MRSRQKSEKLGSKTPGSIPRGKLQKIVDLGKREPTNFYIVNTQGINKQDGIFRLRLTDKDATLSESIITYKDRGGARKKASPINGKGRPLSLLHELLVGLGLRAAGNKGKTQ